VRIYISGPMRGYPQHNFAAFDAASSRIANAGWEPFNPAQQDRERHECVDAESPEFIRAAMRRDLEAIFGCHKVAVLQGWRHSEGAVTEVCLACVLRLPILDALTLHDITAEVREWWYSTLGRGSDGR
jgi:hypothetical protein